MAHRSSSSKSKESAMVDTSPLKPFDPFDLMDVESKRLVDFFDSLDVNGWKHDTRCDGWTRREIVSHLAAGETYNRACLDDKVQQLFEEAEKKGEISSADGKNTVKAGDKEATLSDADLVEAATARLKTIDPELQDALRALA